ncbi:hypothetical protein KKA00_00450 [bacterium]|nr:hypothetical protein [bacterium]MBU1650660.1 hypothetical protein [bacterium]
MTARNWLIILFSLFWCGRAQGAVDFFPEDNAIPGWSCTYEEECRNAEELYKYMNGGAELYLEYRYGGLSVKEFEDGKGGALTIEIYAYAEPWDAFGIYSVDTTGTAIDLGYGGRRTAVAARFWKGNYYVRVFTWEKKPEYSGLPDAAARLVSLKIPDNTDFPDYLKKLRDADLNFAFLRGEIALRQVAGKFEPGDVSFERKGGGVWIFPDGMKSAGVLLLSYTNSEKLEANFQNAWQGLKLRAVNSAQIGSRAMIVSSDGLSHGIEQFSSDAINALIWAPNCPSDAVCAAAIESIKTVFGN